MQAGFVWSFMMHFGCAVGHWVWIKPGQTHNIVLKGHRPQQVDDSVHLGFDDFGCCIYTIP